MGLENRFTIVEECSNWTLVRRLLAIGWRYRWGCIRVLVLGIVLLTIGLTWLSLAEIANPRPL